MILHLQVFGKKTLLSKRMPRFLWAGAEEWQRWTLRVCRAGSRSLCYPCTSCLHCASLNYKTEVTVLSQFSFFVLYHVGDTQQQAYGGITSLWIISTHHMFPYRTCCWTVSFFSSDGWSADSTWRTCVTAAVLDNSDWSCSQTGPALLIMETQHPSPRREQNKPISLFRCFTAL